MFLHQPVLVQEILDFLPRQEGAIIVDGTLGTGGHSLAILQHGPAHCRVVGFDRDGESLETARQRLRPFSERLTLALGAFGDLPDNLAGLGIDAVDFILLDLGFSSFQLASPGRGFSFQRLDPLDLRLDRRQDPTAREWLSRAGEAEIARVLREYGEERWAGPIARAIHRAVREEKMQTTRDLVEAVFRAVPRRFQEQRLHPATRTFQALRIVINDELRQLQRFLEGFLPVLAPRGRVGVIAYHSLEDRLIKQAFQDLEQGRSPGTEARIDPFPHRAKEKPSFKRLTKKPIVPQAEEVQKNPRARGAKLRIGERLETPGETEH